MSEQVKMKIDREDQEWKWLHKKLIKMKKAKLSSEAKAKEEQEAREKERASKIEDGALVSRLQICVRFRDVLLSILDRINGNRPFTFTFESDKIWHVECWC